ncbi:hypothetical protein SAMN06265365_108124 [Tistlia consotensis]|uniref:Uncharacterized protein n=1 Tax=Tistlia consotensis USBA 355 TaxID=560819 RepID=A0A1Y6BW00_9PROT|nr:hypothetical protein [Tistlia consotensis]SMF23959.1 hypothetical protein SAMN05428998_10856 [Tistlia consotensis USBA 355]SNR61060.1 hypothetical protein SAMN06265365_108124 [Tistlia consotensis]
MRAFLAGVCAAVLIAVGSYFVLESLGMSSQAVYSSPNVRLGD